MKKLAESLHRLQELDFMNGPGMQDRPDYTSGQRHGAGVNFDPKTDAGEAWPYEDDGYMNYGVPSGPRGIDRGTQMGTDVHGGAPVPRFQSTWEGGPDEPVQNPDEEVEEGADYDELQRHGDNKYRNVWNDTPEGQDWTELNQSESAWKRALVKLEAAGSPGRIGPVAPMDGPMMHGNADAGPVKDKDGNPVAPQQLAPQYKDMSGPGNMWGGAGTIPGATGGWANMPPRPGDENDPEKNPMKLREFFDPNPIEAESVENPDPTNAKDGSDEEIEGEIDAIHGEEPDEVDEPEADFEMEPPPPAGAESEPQPAAEFQMSMSPSALLPKKPGISGMLPNASAGNAELVNKSSAWDVLQKVVDALGGPPGGGPGPGTGITGM
jgi:hypothetical protein